MPATKRTLLNTYGVPDLPAPTFSSTDIRELRASLNLSRAVFARKLRLPVRTLEGWEAGRAEPPPTAALLLALVRAYPETLQRIAEV
jgi:putative transcriptional regulator